MRRINREMVALEEIILYDSEKVGLVIIIQFFIIYVPSQQPQGQLQTQHSVGTIIQYNTI
jgi:hypothetical protein